MLLQSESQEGCFWPYHFVGAGSAFPYSSVGEVIKSFSTMDGLPNLVRVQVNSCPWAASETTYLVYITQSYRCNKAKNQTELGKP